MAAGATTLFSTPPPPDSLAEEISVLLTVDRLGSTIIPALYRNNQVYLPITEIFRFLEVKMIRTGSGAVMSGFFIDELNSYVIDTRAKRIVVGENERWLADDEFITSETEIFIQPRVIAEAFSIECNFNFRSLHVRMSSTEEFPAIRLMKRAGEHDRLTHPRDSVVIDKLIDRDAGAFRFSIFDWQFGSYRAFDRHVETYDLALGGEFLGGDLKARLNRTMGDSAGWRDIDWQWRFADPGEGFLTQTIYGRGMTPPIPVGYGLIDGFFMTNSPVRQRRSFGSYLVSGQTEPGWTVDVYVNRELVTFTVADEAGHYQVPVPLTYGSTTITLKFLGPWGEERTQEQLIRVPYTFLPHGKFEYAVMGGLSREESPRWLAQGVAQIGLLPDLTVGIGTQYLTRWPERLLLPYGTFSLRINDEILAGAEYTAGYRLAARASHVGPSGRSVEALYQVLYPDPSTPSTSGRLHKGRIGLSTPFHFGMLLGTGGVAGSYEWGSSEFSVAGLEANLGLYFHGFAFGYYLNGSLPRWSGEFLAGDLNSTATISRQIFWQVGARSYLRYDYARKRVTTVGARIERGILGLGQAALSANYSPVDKRTVVQFDFKYDLPFAGSRLTLRSDQGNLSLNQNFGGSISFDNAAGEVLVGNRSAVGRGCITLRPFLDENSNGAFDEGEPAVENLEVRANGGRVLPGEDGIVRITELPPYETCRIELSPRNLEYLSWRPIFKTLDVIVDPNSFKEIPVPITVAGEVLGGVTKMQGGLETAQGGVRVLFKSTVTGKIDTATTFSNGEFDMMGLAAGAYQAFIDPAQLRALGLRSEPPVVDVALRAVREGDVVDNVAFRLSPRPTSSPRGDDPDVDAEVELPFPIGYSRMLTVDATSLDSASVTTSFLDSLAAMGVDGATPIAVEVQGFVATSYRSEKVAELQMFVQGIRNYLIDAGVPVTAIRSRPPSATLVGADRNQTVVVVRIIPR